ncbi:VACUOLAR ATP SYNTHASE CATALYTIC SUBUNIT-RELATED / V-ATPASE-RELATED / VACUOLAR PROTON PUMP-RELATED [Salix viminalis]|uniref:VACUOLAR ATP SYNTHASE CATALYTIC SUBUNIT-RELATED / V-ATPASE-RELATED / VACUOLAR PROTON PUMP-RELATED n=1 Tax=Salix viminalis TaxID=40686 RepID=A0A9Q0NU00_SALVM|nr:VACUOLAR ATP SYNTHASE CATALYTIC SUBUNIT-RELATED / V-ATPASE-RELATED / VACUOLAR PROTON PUMP-RELATED [Salix viminalis]
MSVESLKWKHIGSTFITAKSSNSKWRVRQASAVVQHTGDAREPQQQAAVMGTHPGKINLISCGPMAHVSDIKLIRTDTTLDLSQKAEKGMSWNEPLALILYGCLSCIFVFSPDVVQPKPAVLKTYDQPATNTNELGTDISFQFKVLRFVFIHFSFTLISEYF